MGLLNGLEFAFVLAAVGLLLVFGKRIAGQESELNPLLVLTAAVLLLALFSISGLTVALFKFSLLAVLVVVLIISLVYTTIRR